MKTGRFTSPHLLDVRERISLEGQPIARENFVRAWEDIAPYVGMVDERSAQEGGPRLSFFEVFTIMAYAACREIGRATTLKTSYCHLKQGMQPK